MTIYSGILIIFSSLPRPPATDAHFFTDIIPLPLLSLWELLDVASTVDCQDEQGAGGVVYGFLLLFTIYSVGCNRIKSRLAVRKVFGENAMGIE